MRHLLLVALVLSGCTLFEPGPMRDRTADQQEEESPLVETSEAQAEGKATDDEEAGANGNGNDSGKTKGANLVDGGSCMECHNGSKLTDYAGEGLKNPHPFPGASNLTCTECHGGDSTATGKVASHVPPLPKLATSLSR